MESALAALAARLIYTWDVKTSVGQWIGFQILLGADIGLAGQGSIIAAQASVGVRSSPLRHPSAQKTLPQQLRPCSWSSRLTRVAPVVQTISGAFFIAAAECVFANQLKMNIKALAPGVDAAMLLGQGGAANLRQRFTDETLGQVLQACLASMRSANALALAAGGLAFLFSFAAEWKKVNLDAINQASDTPSAGSTGAQSQQEDARKAA
ncbi:hypothetical protein LTR49_026965 [Elasticomyces elasticus]|nr:hypothetical protein LTR49_026965 [Elasticomyces elasticus]